MSECFDVPKTTGMANPIHVAKLTGVLLPNKVYSIPFSTRLGPVPVVTITDGKQNGGRGAVAGFISVASS